MMAAMQASAAGAARLHRHEKRLVRHEETVNQWIVDDIEAEGSAAAPHDKDLEQVRGALEQSDYRKLRRYLKRGKQARGSLGS